MNLIYTLEEIKPFSIFLAGPTYRINSESDFNSDKSWRNEAIRILEQKGFKGNVLIPEFRDNKFPENWSYENQVKWETEAMHISSVIMFWIPRDIKGGLPAFTTNIEFGEWYRDTKVVVGGPINADNNRYLVTKYTDIGIGRVWNYSLEECVNECLSKLKRRPTIFFTSDTHFSQQRTLEFSKRPFTNVEEMDLKFISNWNGMVYNNDVVYHLGDIGNIEVLSKLNFKELYVIPGNYEVKDGLIDSLSKLERVKVISNNTVIEVIKDNVKYTFELVHEPSKRKTNNFLLFGHIHRLQMVKKNSFNVGVDCHFFKPISIADVLWQRNAILNHYDNEVFLSF